MPFYINTNISSLTAQMNLSNTQSSLSTSLQRLSSGLRINSAKDDAAGLAISQRMTSLISGLSQAQRNANDGISLAQTAEGALGTIGTNLQTLSALAVQSANSTNTSVDRAAIQTQAAQIIAQIQQTATSTQFNGANLLDGTFQNMAFQIGAGVGQTASLSIASSQTSSLGSTQTAALTASNNGTALSQGDLVLNGTTIGSSLASSDTASTTGQSASAIAKVAAINASSIQSGVTAQVNTNTAVGSAQTATAGTGTITINGFTTGTITMGGTNGSADRAAIVAAINLISGQTGVTAVDSGLSANGIQLNAADGRNIAVSITSATGSFVSGTTGVSTGTTYGTYTLNSANSITVTGSTTIANSGLNAGTYQTQTAYASTTAGAAAAFAAGDFSINGILVGASLAASDTASTVNPTFSAIAKVAAINAVSSQTRVTATVNANTANGSAQTATAGTGTFTINGVTTSTVTMGGTNGTTDRGAVIAAINAISGQTGVTAVDGGSSASGVKLIAADGRNINVTITSATGSFVSGTTGVTSGATYGTFTLSSAAQFTIAAGTTGASLTGEGMLAAGVYGSGKTGQALSTVDLSTVTGANNALAAITNAINTVNTIRANLGAMQNRFTNVITTLQNTTTNLSAANSRIMDADFATETANLSRSQILQQAGTAMLAQANQLPSTVLTLLK
ncbi:MAG: hypothetical protein K2P57_03640 [Burkholderiales bacterium]|nr:hypothetical protein [Burkholderiales bacterium]